MGSILGAAAVGAFLAFNIYAAVKHRHESLLPRGSIVVNGRGKRSPRGMTREELADDILSACHDGKMDLDRLPDYWKEFKVK